jgi:hypothetical protein
MLRAARPALESEPHDGKRGGGERQVHEEAPAPGGVVGQPASDGRPEDRRRGEDRAEKALPLSSPAWRDDVANGGDRKRDQAACAEPLDRTSCDQHLHRPREPADHGPEREERDAQEEERPAAVDVRELPVQRDGHRRAEHVRGEDPRVVLEATEIGDDARQSGRDDRLVEGGEQHAEHEPKEDDQRAALAERVNGAVIHIRYVTKVYRE